MTLDSVDLEVDASGLKCPMPLLKAKQGLSQLAAGQKLRLIATDQGSVRDIQSFTNLTCHSLVDFYQRDVQFIYTLMKGESENK